MAIGREFFGLQEKIGYTFKDITLLQTALTHTSYSNEQKNRGNKFSSNERLEFLGDSVLQLAVSRLLFDNYKNRSEGSLTKMRQHLVCEATLSQIAKELNLGEYINIGKGEELTDCRNRPKILADTFEALIGAIYIDSDSNLQTVSAFIISLIQPHITRADAMQVGDYKTLLQQLVEKDGTATLEYSVVMENGPEHNKTFTVVVQVNNNTVGEGTAKTKKDAEMKAAKMALELFGINL